MVNRGTRVWLFRVLNPEKNVFYINKVRRRNSAKHFPVTVAETNDTMVITDIKPN